MNSFHRARNTLCAWLALALPLCAQATQPLAPDGHRGLGAETRLTDLLQTVRANRDEERAFMAELDGLPSDARLLIAGTLERYRSRGYLALLDPRGESGVELLHSEFARLAADPFATLVGGGVRAEAFARMLVDARFRVRGAAIAGCELEIRELERGLAVLRGANAGFVQLAQHEAGNIAARVDLAASSLRALKSDLIALRPTEVDAGADAQIEERARELLRLATAPEGENVRRAGVARECESAARLQAAMERSLFGVRLRERLAALREWRERLFEESQPLLEEALRYLPDTEQGRAAPEAIRALAKHERMRGAGFAALRGLGIDPLDADLAWIAGHCADFQYGITESRPWYDRFLALRGIRAHDHRTYTGRALDARENEALDALQRSVMPAPGKPRGL